MGLMFKKGVRIDAHEDGGITRLAVQPPTIMAILQVAKIFSDVLRKDCVVTSCTEGQHGSNSLHYKGFAADFRTNHLDSLTTKQFLVILINAALNAKGHFFDVLLESAGQPNEHLHLEWQPDPPNSEIE